MMASFMEMSLEDIIQKKKKDTRRFKSGTPKGTMKPKGDFNKQKVPIVKAPVTDARNKIIQKKRKQIVDAREKLAELAKQKDARLKLDQLRKKRAPLTSQGRMHQQSSGKIVKNNQRKERVFVDTSRQVVSKPFVHKRAMTKPQLSTSKFKGSRQFDTHPLERMPRLKPILRTVENDLDLVDDPMGEEFEPPQRSSFNQKLGNLQLRIIAHTNDSRGSRSAAVHRVPSHKEQSPPRPPSILKKRPMAALRSERKTERNEKQTLEYRIIVSNLRSSVTGADIEELFGDVGGMVESRLVRPGTAEVIYKSGEDAQKAVDLYHNRQLDGQPMNCLLVTPRAQAPLAKSATSKTTLISSNSNVEPDISTFYKVLFSKF